MSSTTVRGFRLLSLKFVSAARLQQGSGVRTRGRARAVRRARRAATGLCPSPSTAFNVSFCFSDCTAGVHGPNKQKSADSSSTRFGPACCSVYRGGVLCAVSSMFSVDILLNRSQQLFASCTAKFADGQQCSIPVFDITHQTPLCEEHAKKMVRIEIMFHSSQRFSLHK